MRGARGRKGRKKSRKIKFINDISLTTLLCAYLMCILWMVKVVCFKTKSIQYLRFVKIMTGDVEKFSVQSVIGEFLIKMSIVA